MAPYTLYPIPYFTLFNIFRVLSEYEKKINLTLINISPRFYGAKKKNVPRESRIERMSAAGGALELSAGRTPPDNPQTMIRNCMINSGIISVKNQVPVRMIFSNLYV
jgi:hypothetical protein